MTIHSSVVLALSVLATEPAVDKHEFTDAVAIVCSLSGPVSVREGLHPPNTVHLFDWLKKGALLTVDPSSQLTLAFTSGLRYELGANARASVGLNDLLSRSGPIRQLTPVPPLPVFFTLRGFKVAHPETGGIRLRDQGIRHLSPGRDVVVLSDATLLSFDTVTNAAAYTVTVQDDQGAIVFQTQTPFSAVRVPPLRPGRRYHWSVRTVNAAGWALRGDDDFSTLAQPLAKARAAFREAIDTHDAAVLVLAAEMDEQLGLLIQARDEFAAAVAQGARGTELTKAVIELGHRLNGPPDSPQE
jgi:hypothetical protein